MISTGICRWLFLLISLSTWTKLIDSKEMRIVCYYTNWSVYRPGQAKFSPQNINPYLCTHLIYAFGGFTKENTLKPFDKYQDIEKGGYAKFTGLKTYNKNLKTMIAIGGWNEGSSRFSSMVASTDRRKEMVKNAIKFLRQNHFDGLDLDWEYPTFRDGGKPRDRDNYAQLVKELREEFERESEKTGRTRLILTMAVPAGIEYINKGYDVPKLTKYLDWMNILSYDYHSAFEPAVNHHAPLYSLEEDNEYNYDAELNIDYTIKHYLKLGADPSKLVLGIPTYGRSYTLFNPDAYEIGSPADGPGDMGEATRENGYLAYYEVCEYVKDQDWEVEEPNPKAMGPIAFKDNQWVGYDDENIVRKKAEYVAENSLGGIMFWAIDNDDFRGNCHGKPYPLIEAAKEALINAYGLTEDNLIAPPSKPTKSPKQKSRNRTRKTTTTEPPEESSASTSSSSSRRRRIKSKSKDEDRSLSSPVQKRRKDSIRKAESSTYSSLKIVTPAYTTPAPPATPDTGGAFKCEDEGFYSHPKDCKKYFWCLGGAGDTGIIAHQFTCPAGLYFNKGADSCDYSQNVLCDKKLQKATTTTTEKADFSSDSSEKPTPSSIFSTSRVPPKITAATSKTTFRQTTTTEAYEDEYEYEDEEDEIKPEEDPKVIKELIDLIRKAGGIEQLEKQLKFGKDNSSPTLTLDSTTQSAISKSLVERVLSRTSKNTLNALKKTSVNRNSGGPQGRDSGEDNKEKKVDRGRPQYRTIARQRPSTEKSVEKDDTLEEPVEEEQAKEKKSFRNKSNLEYVNIRRPKSSSTTETNDDDGSSRNKILGETDDEEQDDESEDSEEFTKKSSIPQYVNIRRQRPSTAKDTAASSKYSTIRRTTASPVEPEDEEHNEANEEIKYKLVQRGSTTEPSTIPSSQSFRYQTIRRSTTTSATITEDNEELARRTSTTVTTTSADDYSFISRLTTTPSNVQENNETLSKYQTVRRGSTPPSGVSTSEVPQSTPPSKIEEANSVTESDLPPTKAPETPSNISSLVTENIVSSTHESTTESNNGVSSSTLATSSIASTEINESVTEKKRPVLFQPRPFSVGTGSTLKPTTTESTTITSKVSQSNLRFRLRQTSSPTTTTEASTTTIRSRSRSRLPNINRNLNEDKEQEEKYERTEENKPVRTRKRLPIVTQKPTDFNEDYNRKYRPADLADLSSLTAADLNIRGGEFVSAHRRRRPTVAVTSTTTTEKFLDESETASSRTLPLVRKQINPSAFGKGRRVISKNDDLSNAISEQASTTRRIVRGFRSTTPKTVVEPTPSQINTTVLEDPIRVTTRPRKVFRRFRPTSSPTVASEKTILQEALVTSTTVRTSTLLRKRIPLFRARQTKNEVIPNNVINDTNITTEITSSSENPLLELFKARSRFEIAQNDTIEDDEEDLSNEHTDVLNGEEGENIKLSESNIRESSQVNSFGFDEKPGRRFSKFNLAKNDVFVKSSTEKQQETLGDRRETITEKQDSLEPTTRVHLEVSPTAPSRILRTRKIIRKLSTTEPTTTTEKTSTRRHNIFRRPQPTNRNELEIKRKDENTKVGDKKYSSITRTTTTTTTEPEVSSKESVEKVSSRSTFRPTLERRPTTEESQVNDEKNISDKNEFKLSTTTTVAEVSSVTTPRYNLYTRPTFSTTEYEDNVDESDNDEINNNDDEDDDYNDNEEDDDKDLNEEPYDKAIEYMPKYTIYTTSSIKRTHKYESNTNFDDENEEDIDDGLKANKSVSSHVLTSALNSRNESETILNKDEEPKPEKVIENEYSQLEISEKGKDNKQETEASTKRNNLLHSQKDRPSFTRQRVALSKEEVHTKSKKDSLKTNPGYRSRSTTLSPIKIPTSTPIAISNALENEEHELNDSLESDTKTNAVNHTMQQFIEVKQNVSAAVLETTENIAITTLTFNALAEENDKTDEALLTTTEELKEALLKHVTDEPIEVTDRDDIDETTDHTTDLSTNTTTLREIPTITTSRSLEDSTEKNINNITETTTEYRKRSTLRSIKERPRLGLARRTTEFASPSSTSNPRAEVSSRKSYTRTSAFGKNRLKAPSAAKVPLKPVTLVANHATTSLPVNRFLYKYSTTARSIFEPDDTTDNEDQDFEDEEQSKDDEGSNREQEQNKNVEESEETSNSSNQSFLRYSTTPKIVNKPIDTRTFRKNPNKPQFIKTLNKATLTIENESIESLGVDTEAVKNRNKNLFSKRKMNTPFKTSSIPDVVTTEDTSISETVSIPDVVTTEGTSISETVAFSDTSEFTTTPSNVQTDSTDSNLTTLHHIFSDVDGTESTTESLSWSPNTNSGKVERLIEVNRIVEVKTKQATVNNHSGALEVATKVEIIPTVDKIGEISRITLIKIVDGNNETIIKDPVSNEIGTTVDSSSPLPVYTHEETKGNLEIAKIEEIPASEVMQKVNLKDIQFNINLDNSGLGQRENRKYEIFSESKVSGNKILTNIDGKPEIIDGISHINILTPKPLATETSTISLQGLFQTEKIYLNPSFTTNDEVLETGRSEFVNVRVLDQDRTVRLDKGLLGNTNYIPVSLLAQDDEEVTMKAHVVEIRPKPESRTIKIVPIRVEMSRSLANFKLPPNTNGVKT